MTEGLSWWNRDELEAEIYRLRAALEPFGRNVGAASLMDALGHITREDMERARELTKSV